MRREACKLNKIGRGGLTYYRNEVWADLRHGIFTRRGGVSHSPWRSLNMGASIGDDPDAVKENHSRVYQALDVDGERAAGCWLVHSVDTLVVSEGFRRNGSLQKADAIITNQLNTPLVMRYADCVPLLLYDRAKQAIGLGHAGWRGAVKGMASNMVRMMQKTYGSKAPEIEVVIGPAISRRNYRVGEEVVRQAEAYFGDDAGVIWRDPAGGAAHLDLWRANRLDLERSGVTNIKSLDICTYENTDDFFSHRRENGVTGRFAVVMSL
ncbi:MAG: peptidoglycan editing factor PgeF [Chloroflexi bacterium]|nr:peptidoglycan editing factor PgeF [Chloroflexota bacterium]